MFHYRPAHSDFFHIVYVGVHFLCNRKRATGRYTVSVQEGDFEESDPTRRRSCETFTARWIHKNLVMW